MSDSAYYVEKTFEKNADGKGTHAVVRVMCSDGNGQSHFVKSASSYEQAQKEIDRLTRR